MAKIYWFQPLKCDSFLVFNLFCDSKLNIFGLLAGLNKTSERHHGLWEHVIGIFSIYRYFMDQTITLLIF